MSKNLSTKPYKGVRDFYPQDWMLQKWMFWKMAEVCERYGYEQYNASPLEPSELYEAKTGEEIIQNETYNLIDRGDRRVTLRPEMTPTVARMVADQLRELPKPVRWYSIPNLFRYERPQRGRLREHYQLNVDLFGVSGPHANLEVLSLGAEIMHNMGATAEHFSIVINNRKIINALFARYTDNPETVHALSKLIDKKAKLETEKYSELMSDILGEQATEFIDTLEHATLERVSEFADTETIDEVRDLIQTLVDRGVTNVSFDITLMRGFDYYTDIVFEFFDTHPENNRSLFGGGRYDDLLDIFDMEKVPAIGFGMGDVTAKDFLETHGLLPTLTSQTQVYVACTDTAHHATAQELVDQLRGSGINTEFDFTYRNFDKMISAADKKLIPYFVTVGEDETDSATFTLKNLTDGTATQDLTPGQLIEQLQTATQ